MVAIGWRCVHALRRRDPREGAELTCHVGLIGVPFRSGKVRQIRPGHCIHPFKDTFEPPATAIRFWGQLHPLGECASEMALAETGFGDDVPGRCGRVESSEGMRYKRVDCVDMRQPRGQNATVSATCESVGRRPSIVPFAAPPSQSCTVSPIARAFGARKAPWYRSLPRPPRK